MFLIAFSGTAEIFGTELAIGPIYSFSGVKLALFTWRGCVIDVKGTPSVHYLAEETPMLAKDIGSIPGSVSVTSISGILDVENVFGSTLTTGILCASKMTEIKEVKHSGCIIDTAGTIDQSKGCVSREMSFIQKMQHFAIRKYFYGDFKTVLSPYSIVCDFDSLIVYRVEEGLGVEIFAHSSALPIGHDVSSQKPQMIKIEAFSILQNSILAVSHANINDSTNVILESPVAGYIYVSDVDDNKKKLTILSPLPGKLPGPILIMGSLKWQDL
ncbi:hypothetical protein PCK2_000817 [Pneumocystis canis]|nr:hypothetical protein PCK2_000817 [Pneumocystis canis]